MKKEMKLTEKVFKSFRVAKGPFTLDVFRRAESRKLKTESRFFFFFFQTHSHYEFFRPAFLLFFVCWFVIVFVFCFFLLIVDKREATVNEEDTHENDYWILKLEVFHVMLALWKKNGKNVRYSFEKMCCCLLKTTSWSCLYDYYVVLLLKWIKNHRNINYGSPIINVMFCSHKLHHLIQCGLEINHLRKVHSSLFCKFGAIQTTTTFILLTPSIFSTLFLSFNYFLFT